jgi:hypothetical protein
MAKRSAWLEAEAVGWRGDLIQVLESLRVPRARLSWAVGGWIATMVAGYLMTDLGQEREFNLLALPLVGLLAWNAVVITLGLLCELLPAHTLAGRGGWLAEFLAHGVSRGGQGKTQGESPAAAAVRGRFVELAWPLAWRRLQAQTRTWLHIAAAMLALGGITALYVRGWSKEYRAVWESTLLHEGRREVVLREAVSSGGDGFGHGDPAGQGGGNAAHGGPGDGSCSGADVDSSVCGHAAGAGDRAARAAGGDRDWRGCMGPSGNARAPCPGGRFCDGCCTPWKVGTSGWRCWSTA